ncbi:MAG: formyltransferase family protein [Acidobacteriota bacterium]
MLTIPPPLRVALLTSHRSPGLPDLLRDPLHGAAYALVGVISSEHHYADGATCASHDVPVRHRPIRAFHRAARAALSDRTVRERFDEALAEALAAWRPDVVLCCGYLYVLTAPVLDRWPGAVFNLHHSDMLDRDAARRPRYPGLRAVRDAIVAGAVETRTSVHVVTDALDDGPVVMRSWAFPVSPLAAEARRLGAADLLKAYVWAHQEWMLRRAWGPLMVRTLVQASIDRGRLARGQMLSGAPWDLFEDGRLAPARRAVPEGVRQ